jgi:predicted TIM-barrel fold metal-dependent hydrolase
MAGGAMSTFGCISADSHVNEPRDLWSENLPRHLRADAMRGIEAGDDGSWSVVLEGRHVAKAGMKEAERLAVLDPSKRLDVMREEGVVGECIFPTIGLYVWMLDSADGQKHSCRIYNEWIFDQLHSQSPRFCCAGLVPTARVADAIEEVRFVADIGLGAVMLPTVPHKSLTVQPGTYAPNWNHPDWEPLWSTVEETGLPIVMHQGTGHDMIWYRGPGATIANLLATQSMAPRTATLLATSGVLERHPGLRFVFVEYGAGWYSWMLETIDYYTAAFRRYDTDPDFEFRMIFPELEHAPSEYVRRQVYTTFQEDYTGLTNLGSTGADSLMWGADYPHEEGTYPLSRDVVERQLSRVDPEQARKLFRDNAATVFGFPGSILSTPV